LGIPVADTLEVLHRMELGGHPRIMYETLEGSVLHAEAVSIHGAIFYDLVLQTQNAVRKLRFQDTFLSPAPKQGECLQVVLILGNVHEVKRISCV
jgi:hypothetical protein